MSIKQRFLGFINLPDKAWFSSYSTICLPRCGHLRQQPCSQWISLQLKSFSSPKAIGKDDSRTRQNEAWSYEATQLAWQRSDWPTSVNSHAHCVIRAYAHAPCASHSSLHSAPKALVLLLLQSFSSPRHLSVSLPCTCSFCSFLFPGMSVSVLESQIGNKFSFLLSTYIHVLISLSPWFRNAVTLVHLCAETWGPFRFSIAWDLCSFNYMTKFLFSMNC